MTLRSRGLRAITASAAAVAGAALLLTGCAGGSPVPATTSPDAGSTSAPPADLSPIKVGYLPTADNGALFIAKEKGFFADEGLTIESMEPFAGGSQLVPALESGSLNVGFTSILSVLKAKEAGLPVQCIVGSHHLPTEIQGAIAVAVKNVDTIKSAKDLDGKVIAVNAPGDIIQLSTQAWIDKNGGDSTKVTFQPIPFPDMPAALAQGTVDAAFTVEPFTTISGGMGVTFIGKNPPLAFLDQDGQQSCFVAATSWIESHKAEAQAFRNAIIKADDFAAEDPDYLRTILPDIIGMDPAIANKIHISVFYPEIPDKDLQAWMDVAIKYGQMKGKVSFDGIRADLD